jgi:hypothetical protein
MPVAITVTFLYYDYGYGAQLEVTKDTTDMYITNSTVF